MNIFRNVQIPYRCHRCFETYSATEQTEKQVLHGVCWACTYVEGLSYSQQDWYFLGIEEALEMEDYWS